MFRDQVDQTLTVPHGTCGGPTFVCSPAQKAGGTRLSPRHQRGRMSKGSAPDSWAGGSGGQYLLLPARPLRGEGRGPERDPPTRLSPPDHQEGPAEPLV